MLHPGKNTSSNYYEVPDQCYPFNLKFARKIYLKDLKMDTNQFVNLQVFTAV